jgi:large subunit ribosomal protein L9
MRVILLEKVRNLGNIGVEINVKNGYARNFLIPQKKAITATKDNLARIAEKRAELEQLAENSLVQAKERAEVLAKLGIVLIKAKVSDEGKLFGSINIRDIISALKDIGIEVKKSEISLPQGPMRQIGEYDVDVLLHPDVTETIKVKVEPEAATMSAE